MTSRAKTEASKDQKLWKAMKYPNCTIQVEIAVEKDRTVQVKDRPQAWVGPVNGKSTMNFAHSKDRIDSLTLQRLSALESCTWTSKTASWGLLFLEETKLK